MLASGVSKVSLGGGRELISGAPSYYQEGPSVFVEGDLRESVSGGPQKLIWGPEIVSSVPPSVGLRWPRVRLRGPRELFLGASSYVHGPPGANLGGLRVSLMSAAECWFQGASVR